MQAGGTPPDRARDGHGRWRWHWHGAARGLSHPLPPPGPHEANMSGKVTAASHDAMWAKRLTCRRATMPAEIAGPRCIEAGSGVSTSLGKTLEIRHKFIFEKLEHRGVISPVHRCGVFQNYYYNYSQILVVNSELDDICNMK